ncbi:MAG TPA: RlmE family RNA methyltransferase, partial [Nitrososphaerales archaeon]|nr:RlmE family RNA methyltransferase [Nitrososphaerales archaeon]
AFKLIEADEKYGFIHEADRVADFGAAPGGWLQVCSELVGPEGIVVGVDIHPIHLKERNVKALALDVNDPSVAIKVAAALGGKADVVLSDLSPTVSGVWELDHIRQVDLTMRALSLCDELLKKGGHGFFKLFEGERSQEARNEMKGGFREVRVVKPKASRSQSSELYYYCEGWRGPAATLREGS